ncbi:MAG: hypothetical protein GAK30_03456 [Paracidovorax wautersii]|uniref:General secretion pathway protein C n=1 Tax=Paracidovorax wautersii TaxID=1177982 RepID=A0A7V8FL72_9BURK|nr:MAG: hypothetical protein GAK30_03456 [Paracidovorax wautersii]
MFRATLPRLPALRPSLALPGPRLTTVLVWACAAAVAVYWGTRLVAMPRPAGDFPVATSAPALADPAALARLLGAQPTAAPAAVVTRSKAVLLGVVAQDPAGGVALIAVDDAPPRPYRIGTPVADGYRLASADTRRATLQADGKPDWVLDMPKEFTPVAAASRPGSPAVQPAPVVQQPPPATPQPRRPFGGPQRQPS